MTVNRKTVIFISLLVVGILLWITMFLIYSSITGNKTPMIVLPTLTPYPKISPYPSFQVKKAPTPGAKITAAISPSSGAEGGFMLVSGVKINDISKVGKVIDTQGDMVFSDDKRYQIMYLPLYKIFYVTVLEAPFAQNRIPAENYFIKTLGISQDQSCRLTVYVEIPENIDPVKGGKKYNLSWCVD